MCSLTFSLLLWKAQPLLWVMEWLIDLQRPFALIDHLQRLSMGPRKKSKPNPQMEEGEGKQQQEQSSTSKSAELPMKEAETANAPDAPSSSLRDVGASLVSQSTPLLGSGADTVQKQVDSRASWYGSWRGRPAKPVAEVAKDSVPGTSAIATTQSSISLPQSPRVQPNDRRTSNAAVPPSPRRYMSGSFRSARSGGCSRITA